ncbi:MAG TPA: c-type cytochrome [Kofleriaceae bacterium]|nr:c-type cytochrome [Kofleriaceae bacterium]
MRRLAFALVAVGFVRPTAAHEPDFSPPPMFGLLGQPVGGVDPAPATFAAETGSRIAVAGDGALVIDADSGELVRTDAAGAPVAAVAIGDDPGLLAYDERGKVAYVADRHRDRVVEVAIGDALTIVRAWPTPAEPYGVALAPDRRTLLVTAIADRAVVAYDAPTGLELWRRTVDAEPRGVAISADGKQAAVGSLASGAIQLVALADPGHPVTRRALPVEADGGHARAAFAVTFLGNGVVVAPYQESVPAQPFAQVPDHYGGGIVPPITHELAFVALDGRTVGAQTALHEPRAVAWDPARDALYFAGPGSDSLVQIDQASQVDITQGFASELDAGCGADGLALAPGGDVLVWCSFSRKIARVAPNGDLARRGPEIAASRLDAAHHRGLVLFHTSTADVSAFATVACANCHLDGRTDGLSWQIHGSALQTPMLAGRLVGTAPFKWDGGAKDLVHSVRATLDRLGGSGLSRRDLAALTGYLEALPPVRTPTRDPAAVARGKALYESAEVGCTQCHDGPAYTDTSRHALVGAHGRFDTPSLIGIAASAPYFHDGSAATLEVVLRDRGAIHGMTDGSPQLGDAQIADLVAFLETR